MDSDSTSRPPQPRRGVRPFIPGRSPAAPASHDTPARAVRARPFTAPVTPSGSPVVSTEVAPAVSWPAPVSPSYEEPVVAEAPTAMIASELSAVEDAIAETLEAPLAEQEPAVLEIPSWAGQSTAAGWTEIANTAEMAAIVDEQGADAAANAHTAEFAVEEHIEAVVAQPSPAEAVGWGDDEDSYGDTAETFAKVAEVAEVETAPEQDVEFRDEGEVESHSEYVAAEEVIAAEVQAPSMEDDASEDLSEHGSEHIDEDVVGHIMHRAMTDASPEASDDSIVRVERLKQMEPWAVPARESSVSEAATAVADALERVAGRLRSGDVELIAGMPHESDEGSLAAALASLLRSPRR